MKNVESTTSCLLKQSVSRNKKRCIILDPYVVYVLDSNSIIWCKYLIPKLYFT